MKLKPKEKNSMGEKKPIPYKNMYSQLEAKNFIPKQAYVILFNENS